MAKGEKSTSNKRVKTKENTKLTADDWFKKPFQDLMDSMTDQMIQFCEKYLQLGNGAEAARQAGYAAKGAHSQANYLLNNAKVVAYIRHREKEIIEKNKQKLKSEIATTNEVLEFLTSVMRGEVKDQFDLDPSLDTRLSAGKELAKRYNIGVDKKEDNESKVDKLFKEVRNQIVGDNND